jgi:hypothetical protein
MNNAKHTPGPWKCNREGLITKDDRYGLHIAQVATVGMGHAIQPNAHLIAAAPTMYADLCAARDYLFELYDEGNAKAGEYAASLGITIEQAEGQHHE